MTSSSPSISLSTLPFHPSHTMIYTIPPPGPFPVPAPPPPPLHPPDHPLKLLRSPPATDCTATRPLPEFRPNPDDGAITVDDASHATRILLHAGPQAPPTYPCVAPLDRGSPQAFIQQSVWARMLTPNAATASAVRPTANHDWSGFGEATSLLINFSIRMSIEFLRSDTPTAKVAVWAFLVLDRAVACPVLLDRDSWMCFKHRIRVTLSPPEDHPDTGLLSELSLNPHPPASRAEVFNLDPTVSGNPLQLTYTGETGASLVSDPQNLLDFVVF